MRKCIYGLIAIFITLITCMIVFSACDTGDDKNTEYETVANTESQIDEEQTESPTTEVVTLTECEMNGHKWIEATCTTPKICEVCNATGGEALGHNEISHDGKEATCTDDGWKAYVTCSRCEYTTFEKIEKSGHDEINHEGKEPTCTEDGWKSYVTCSRCDYTTFEKIEAQHNFKDGICDICGERQSEGLEYELNADGTYSVVGIGTCTDTRVVIPAIYDGKSVSGIGNSAFKGNENIMEVVIGKSVTSIGWMAFCDCNNLISVTIGENVTSIGAGAFRECANLTSITIPDGIMSIGNNAFLYCKNLSYNVYDNAKYLGNEDNPYVALIKVNDTEITSCQIHENTQYIISGAFSWCGKLTDINYSETTKEWNDIIKETYWDSNTEDYVVHCKDGEITKSDRAGKICNKSKRDKLV